MRMVIDGPSILVYGPGARYSHCRFGEALDATLHQAALEQHLVLDGWTLEQLTTERRTERRPPEMLGFADRRRFRVAPPTD